MERSDDIDILLIAGLWLDAGAWDRVLPGLRELGRRPAAVSLPGQGDGAASATLDDQLAAVVAAVDAASGPVTVVGHSAASTLAWLAADARPEKVGRAVFVGGFPAADGRAYAPFFDIVDGAMPFPGWAPFEGPDSADLDEEARRAFTAAAIPVPEKVATGVVRLTDERRYRVPATVVCPEFTPADVRAWIAAGDVPELAKIEQLELVDIASGHWPMFTRPAELARVLAGSA